VIGGWLIRDRFVDRVHERSRPIGQKGAFGPCVTRFLAQAYDDAMGRHADPTGVAVAQLIGTAAGYAQVKRCTRHEALVELEQVLFAARSKPGSHRARELLTRAAALYVLPSGPGDEFWYPTALGLLVEAGADVDRAVEIRAGRRGHVRLR